MSPKNRSKSPFAVKFVLENLEARETPAVFTTVSPAGVAASVTVLDSSTWATNRTITPFGGFTGGITVALADVNADGTDDVVVASGRGGTGNLEIYNGSTGALLRTQSLGNVDTSAGVSIASAGKNAAGEVLLLVGAVIDGASTVEVLNLTKQTTGAKLTPFGTYDGGLSVAAADVNADGTADFIVGAGFGGGPRLAVINGANGARLYDNFMFETFFNGGINVGVGDLNADGKAEIIVGAGVKGGPRVRVLNTTTWTTTQDFFAFDSSERQGVTATAYSAKVGGAAQIIARSGRDDSIKAIDPASVNTFTATTLTGVPFAPIATGVTGPTYVPPATLPNGADEEGMVDQIPNKDAPEWQTQSNGVKIWDTAAGSGDATVSASSTIDVYYTGWLLNGTRFDSSREPATPARFPLSNLIQGWQTGLIGAKVGTIRRLYIPSALAYGAAGSGSSIPPNSDLIFELKIKGIS